MELLVQHAKNFQDISQRVFEEMFGVENIQTTDVVETTSVETSKSFIVSLYYTGTVYGEYILAMDETTAAAIVGYDEEITDENREEIRDAICDAIRETLNMVVGEAIVSLQDSFAKLTITSPRVYFGSVRYPQFQTARCSLQTHAGEVECHFCLDQMRLSLATSYEEAMGSLIEINNKLKEANRHLAEQQAQLVHTEKMASIGMLASGVAHEINNPLFFVDTNLHTLNDYLGIIESAVSLYTSLFTSFQHVNEAFRDEMKSLQEEADTEDVSFVLEDTRALVTETRDGIERIKEIVNSLKEFSDVDRSGHAAADLNTIAANAYKLVKGQIPENCEVELELGQIPKLECNAGEIGQVLTNVLLNAGQAVGEEGKISIATTHQDAEVVLVVNDNGSGIPASEIGRVFEPFYSNKPEGEGKGLGLSIAHGLVQKHNGTISVESEESNGTKVTVRLPTCHSTQPEPIPALA